MTMLGVGISGWVCILAVVRCTTNADMVGPVPARRVVAKRVLDAGEPSQEVGDTRPA